MTSPDVYSYIAYAKLGTASYGDQPYVISPENLPVPDWCLRRFLPAAYGPGFIYYVKMLLAFPHLSPIMKIVLLRATNAAWFLLFLFILRAAGASGATIAVASLNPGILFQYVANAHNDVIAVAFATGGIVLAMRSTIAGLIACIAAGLVKLPFILIGAVIFAHLPSARNRFSLALLAAVVAIVISYATAGLHYFKGLSYYNRLFIHNGDPLQYICAFAALWATFSALAYRQYNHISIYAFPALAVQMLVPWYAAWSLPYALRERTHLASFLVFMPIMLILMETGIARVAQLSTYFCVCALIAIYIIRDRTC